MYLSAYTIMIHQNQHVIMRSYTTSLSLLLNLLCQYMRLSTTVTVPCLFYLQKCVIQSLLVRLLVSRFGNNALIYPQLYESSLCPFDTDSLALSGGSMWLTTACQLETLEVSECPDWWEDISVPQPEMSDTQWVINKFWENLFLYVICGIHNLLRNRYKCWHPNVLLKAWKPA